MQYLKTGLEILGAVSALCTVLGHALLLFPKAKPVSDRLLAVAVDLQQLVKGAQ